MAPIPPNWWIPSSRSACTVAGEGQDSPRPPRKCSVPVANVLNYCVDRGRFCHKPARIIWSAQHTFARAPSDAKGHVRPAHARLADVRDEILGR